MPKLTDSLKKASYIEQKNGVAQTDGKRLLDDKHRKLSNGLRAVELDQLVEGKKKKVSFHLQVILQYVHEEINRICILEADQRSVLDRPACMRAKFFIVTLTNPTTFIVLS